MSRENLDFTNFKLLFLKPIFHGLSPSAKMAKVEEKHKARIKLAECDGRLCVHAASDQGGYHKNWQAPWRAKDGSPLVILRGY